MYGPSTLKDLRARADRLQLSADDTGCTDDMIVCSKAALTDLVTAIRHLEANPGTLYVGIHGHRHGDSRYAFLVPAGGEFTDSDLEAHLTELYEPELEETLEVEAFPEVTEIAATGG